MKVNTSEMMEQIKQLILKSDKYARLEILTNPDEDMPYAKFDCRNVGPETIAYLICEAKEIIDKIAIVLEKYDKNIIEVEGHTDNVPMTSGRYENNNVLSMFRALEVADYLREKTDLNPAYIKSSGRGEYDPIASNETAEGRARNRRVVIKIYNSYSSQIEE